MCTDSLGDPGCILGASADQEAMNKPGDRDRRPYSNSLYCGVSSTRCRHTKDMQSSISFRYSFVTKSSHNNTAQVGQWVSDAADARRWVISHDRM